MKLISKKKALLMKLSCAKQTSPSVIGTCELLLCKRRQVESPGTRSCAVTVRQYVVREAATEHAGDEPERAAVCHKGYASTHCLIELIQSGAICLLGPIGSTSNKKRASGAPTLIKWIFGLVWFAPWSNHPPILESEEAAPNKL